MTKWLMIEGHTFTAAIAFDDFNFFPVEWAPYLKFMQSWHLDTIQDYCRRKRWHMSWVE